MSNLPTLEEAIKKVEFELRRGFPEPMKEAGYPCVLDSGVLIVLLQAVKELSLELTAWKIAGEIVDSQPPGLTLRELLGGEN